MDKKILGVFASLLVFVLLTTPFVLAKPTIKSVVFRIESWPALMEVGDYSKFKMVFAGESGNIKLIKVPTCGVPPLIDYVPDSNPTVWLPFALSSRGGVRLTIDGMGTFEGTVEAMITHTNTFADGSGSGNEKWTFTFDDGALEVSAKYFTDGISKCVGTRGTGIFEGAQFTGTFEISNNWYYLPAIDLQANFKIQEGTGVIMFK